MRDIQITNLETIPGRTITRHLGMVQGNTVRAKLWGAILWQALKT